MRAPSPFPPAKVTADWIGGSEARKEIFSGGIGVSGSQLGVTF